MMGLIKKGKRPTVLIIGLLVVALLGALVGIF
jgi:mannose/fructose/N-acetylgalactosamine-specific phosphotransferase system component IID